MAISPSAFISCAKEVEARKKRSEQEELLARGAALGASAAKADAEYRRLLAQAEQEKNRRDGLLKCQHDTARELAASRGEHNDDTTAQ